MPPQSERVVAPSDEGANKESRSIAAACGVLAVLVFAVFANGIGGVFVFDDEPTLLRNQSIQRGGLWGAFSPPLDSTTVGRPLANATFAANYAMGGLDPCSYHVVNILIHTASALVLFGVVRRCLLFAAWRGRMKAGGAWLSLAVAALWAVHPLQTESVTYVVQRVESLAGLLYLATVYCFLKSMDSPEGWIWRAGAVLACAAGAGCKEIVVSAPLMVWLIDRTWVAGSFGGALRERRWMYVGLACSWLLLAALVASAANRSGTAGLGTASSWQYLLTQCGAILHYLKLVVWPVGLVFDHGNALVSGLGEVWWQAAVLCGLAAGTVVAIVRRSWLGVAGFWFFAILAPSSSVVPVLTQTVAEHRMYLPLAAAVVVAVLAVGKWIGSRSLFVFVAVGLVLGAMTVRRNADYTTKVSIWADTVEKRPENWRARNNLALALAESGRAVEAVAQYEKVLEQVPGDVVVRNNFASALVTMGRAEEALCEINGVLGVAPQIAEFHDTRGLVLAALGRKSEAEACFREALRLKPELTEAARHLGEISR